MSRKACQARSCAMLVGACSLLAPMLASMSLLAAACGGDSEEPETTVPPGATETPTGTPPPPELFTPPPGEANLLGNPGLEEDTIPWFPLREEGFQLSDVAHSGEASALLTLRLPAETQGDSNRALVQEVAPPKFPEIISGYYRVENWSRGAPLQFIQVGVVVFDASNLDSEFPNHQVRYILAGLGEEPGEVRNARFVFVNPEEPTEDEWLYFEFDIEEDFQELWEAVPEGYSRIRILLAVDYGRKVPGNPVEADVYFDDLYMGPASANPNGSETP